MAIKRERFNIHWSADREFADIYDMENTEPVCRIFAKWHPEKVAIILTALKKKCGNKISAEAKKYWGIK
jgi:hypothetical protein